MVCELPGTQANVCGDVKVAPSTTIEPDGFAVTVMDTVAGDDVAVAVESVVETVELVVEVAVVVVTTPTSSRKVVPPLFPSI
jgi:carbonic anhydrase/acetyltransferase-like protein (isoleucine patch superfamily)